MGVIKLNSSLKALQFVTDEGVVYQTSRYALQKLLDGNNSSDFTVPQRMPWGYAENRFPKSPVYEGPTRLNLSAIDDAIKNRDAGAQIHVKYHKEQKPIDDSAPGDW